MPYPDQVRSIDAFNENRFSSVINRFTRLLTGVSGANVIVFPKTSFVLSADSTSDTSVVVAPGICIKDDVMVQVTHPFSIDLSDSNNYIDDVGGMVSVGDYLVVIQYSYARTLPSPKASYWIIRDGATHFDESRHVLVGVVSISYDGHSYNIAEIQNETTTYPRSEIDIASLVVVDGGVIA